MNFETSETFNAFRTTIRNFVEHELEPISQKVELESEIPEEIVDRIRQLGLFGMPIPKEYGGLGLSTLEEIITYEEITRTNALFPIADRNQQRDRLHGHSI